VTRPKKVGPGYGARRQGALSATFDTQLTARTNVRGELLLEVWTVFGEEVGAGTYLLATEEKAKAAARRLGLFYASMFVPVVPKTGRKRIRWAT
jgi:hypothetical protein